MKCYFCQRELTSKMRGSLIDFSEFLSCMAEHNVDHVIMTPVDEKHPNDLLFAHIYINGPDYQVIQIPTLTPMGGTLTQYLSVGHRYQFRLEIADNQTYLVSIQGDNYQNLAILPGLNITPANAKQKLKTYLTFL